ncbi:hypothetical protein IWW38_006222, partial [Coemansia aciculifera]
MCDSCSHLSQEEQANRVLVIKSMYVAMRRSKRILLRANEAARETANQANSADFFSRIDSASELSQAAVGRLMTSSRVSAKTVKEYEEVEAYLFENELVLCKALEPVQSSRSAKFRRTLSSLTMTMRNSSPSPTRLEDKRRSGSSTSSSTLHTRSPTPDNDSPLSSTTPAEFQLPSIATNDSPSLISPTPQPAAAIKLLSSYASLVSLRDINHHKLPMPVIKFTSSTDVTMSSTSECSSTAATMGVQQKSKYRMSRLCARERYPTGAISQISQAHELNGTVRLSIQIMMASGAEKCLVFRRLTRESADIWSRMIKCTVPLVEPEDEGENAAQNAYHCLL